MSTHPTVTARLTLEQVEAMLIHLLRLPELFSVAKEKLLSSNFRKTSEAQQMALWQTAVKIDKETGAGAIFDNLASAQKLMEVETKALLTADPDDVPFDMSYLFSKDEAGPGLIHRIFAVTKQQELSPAYGRELLCKFLHERQVAGDLVKVVKNAGDDTITNLDEVFDKIKVKVASIEEIKQSAPLTLVEEWSDFEKRLEIYRGRELVGLKTGMTELDARTLGLRGLIVLGAGPGVGKTTYGLQLGLGVCKHNTDAVFLMVSLEMDRWSMYTRLLCNLAQLDWKTVMLGSATLRKKAKGPCLTDADSKSIEKAKQQLKDSGIGKKILVADRGILGERVTGASILRQLKLLKNKNQAKRALVIIDYIQRIPVPLEMAKRGDLEADRYRVQVVQDLAEATKTAANPAGDAVLVISETRKPVGKRWESSGLSELMGSARLPYAVDAALLYRPMRPNETQGHSWHSAGIPIEDEEDLQKAGISPVMLMLAKGRDGMQQGEWPMAFHFQQSRFVEVITGPPAKAFTPPPAVVAAKETVTEIDPAADLDPFK